MPDAVVETRFAFLNARELVLVLEATNWTISGRDSAAELLGVKPTTLLSRVTKWGLKKPEQAKMS